MVKAFKLNIYLILIWNNYILEGSESDDTIRAGYTDLGISGGAGGDRLVGNKRDNILDGGAGNDNIIGHGGNDTITTGEGQDRADGGEGIDTVVYDDQLYVENNIRQAGKIVNVANTDTLTNIEFIQYSDVRISTETLAITPVLEVEDISLVEGNAGNTTVAFTFNLSTPAAADIQFDYSTVDGEAIAGSDYVATSEQVTIAAGETSTTIEVEIIGDTDQEPDELFALNLSGISGATFVDHQPEFSVLANIENDDFEPIVLSGTAEDDVLEGGQGNDTLNGGGGNDYLISLVEKAMIA